MQIPFNMMFRLQKRMWKQDLFCYGVQGIYSLRGCGADDSSPLERGAGGVFLRPLRARRIE